MLSPLLTVARQEFDRGLISDRAHSHVLRLTLGYAIREPALCSLLAFVLYSSTSQMQKERP